MIGSATGALLTAVWQGVLLAAVVGLGLRMLPKTPAAVRFAIWFGVFVVVTALPSTSLWPHEANATQAGGRGAWLTLDVRWSLAIAVAWGAASLVRAVKLAVAAVKVRGLWKRAKAVEVAGADGMHPTHRRSAMDGVPGILDGAAACPGLKPVDLSGVSPRAEARSYSGRRAELCVSDEVDRPTVIGFFAPKILIPTWLLEKLTPAELEQIVLHEAGHLGRADDWMNLLQKIALVIFPLNPALAWVERRLCFERELAVDERVLRAFAGRPDAATAYASCLATVAEHRLGRRGLALALGALGRESELGRRVRRILRRGETMRPAHARLVLGGALMALLGATAGLERCPELVGFAVDQPVVAQADVLNVDEIRVATRSLNTSTNTLEANVPHEVLATASLGPVEQIPVRKSEPQRLKPPSGELVYGTAEAVPSTKTAALGRINVSSQEPRTEQVVQWLVVTEWQGADGASRTSRMVLTTAGIENPAARAQKIQSDMAPAPEQDSDQVHPYAAVPVRGGWLVFQL